jgi:hypothetical protein
MDAALPLILLALRAQARSAPGSPARRSQQPQSTIAAGAWRRGCRAVGGRMLSGRHVGGLRVRSAWIRALGEVSFVRSRT